MGWNTKPAFGLVVQVLEHADHQELLTIHLALRALGAIFDGFRVYGLGFRVWV